LIIGAPSGSGIPIQGEQRTTELVNGNTAWNLNAQGQPVAQPAVGFGVAIL
jgi:hypothetical protein